MSSKVTKLGTISPIVRLFPLGSTLKSTEVHGPILGATFSTSKVMFLTKNWLGYVLGVFSQIHLVTLIAEPRLWVESDSPRCGFAV
jgi:hypothetical protein